MWLQTNAAIRHLHPLALLAADEEVNSAALQGGRSEAPSCTRRIAAPLRAAACRGQSVGGGASQRKPQALFAIPLEGCWHPSSLPSGHGHSETPPKAAPADFSPLHCEPAPWSTEVCAHLHFALRSFPTAEGSSMSTAHGVLKAVSKEPTPSLNAPTGSPNDESN